MMKRVSPMVMLPLLLAVCFALATTLQPRAMTWTRGAEAGSIFKLLLGDGRRLFAEQISRQADISFHSGYYPSIFDQSEKPKPTAMGQGQSQHNEEEHEKEMAVAMGQSRDWVESFGRNFRVTEHTHLAHGQEREILPWLRLSAELDPEHVDTYTVAAYWLRKKLGKVDEAEQFLREGLRNNPESFEILFELGCLYSENKNDPVRARNVWELALKKWMQQEPKKKEPDLFKLEQIAVHLATIEEGAKNYARAIELLELAKKSSPNPIGLQIQINEIREKMAAGAKSK